MTDDDYYAQKFVESMGEPTSRSPALQSVVERYRNRLPNVLLKRWEKDGWCGYKNGLFWTVNPEQFKHVVSAWVKGTVLEPFGDFHVFARTAFGGLYAWSERFDTVIIMNCFIGIIVAIESDFKKPPADRTEKSVGFMMEDFFGNTNQKRCDFADNEGVPLFDKALARLGPLSSTEVYGFEPALVLGGEPSVDHLAKLQMEVHLHILRDFCEVDVFGFGLGDA